MTTGFNSPSNNVFINQPVREVVGISYTALAMDRFIDVNSPGAPATITLPAPAATGLTKNVGHEYTIKDIGGNAAVNNVTVVVSGGATIDGSASYVLNQNLESVVLYSDGLVYWVSAQGDLSAVSATTYNEDAGSATPAAGILNVNGTSLQGITTSGAGNTVTISALSAGLAQNGTVSLASNAQTIAGVASSPAVTPVSLAAKLGAQTAHAVALGEGVGSPLSYVGPGANGNVLTGMLASDPMWAAPGTNSGLTAHGVMLAEGNSPFVATAALGNGALVIGSVGVDPVVANLTAGSGVSIVNGPGTITINAVPIVWQTITANQALVAGNGYIVTSGALTLSLPATSAVGDTFYVSLQGGTSWSISQAAGQSIRIGNTSSTVGVGGSLSSNAQGDGVQLVASVANTNWFNPVAPQGNLAIV